MLSATRSLVREPADVLAATGAILFITWLGDLLFWKSQPGISVGIFTTILATTLMATGQRSGAAWVAMALLLASSVQSAIELCFTNVACLTTALLVIIGETRYNLVSRGWPRWSEALLGFFTAPLRWGEIVASFVNTRLVAVGLAGARSGLLTQFIAVAFPAVIAAGVFAFLLIDGNAILYQFWNHALEHLLRLLQDISFARTAMWVAWLTAGIGFFWPSAAPEKARWWTLTPGPWVRNDPRLGRWQSGLLLLVVNAIFFTANTIDAAYLWTRMDLPEGVNHSQFVHEGVRSLIIAVVLAALVLVVTFHQHSSVSNSRILKGLALAWIVQNLALIASVFLRLFRYIDVYQLSELRVYTGCFLLLVCTGFGFLAWHIVRCLRIDRLIFQNVCATFVLFFTLQWCDVGTWVAQSNVARWEANPDRVLDLGYLAALGHRGWPAIAAVAGSEHHTNTAEDATLRLRETAVNEFARLETPDWRSYQARRDIRARRLVQDHLP